MDTQNINSNLTPKPQLFRLSRKTERLLALVVIVFYVALAIGFSLGPIFEGPDEIDHYKFIRYVVQNKSLPNPFVEPGAQYHQAPLYYMLGAPFSLLSNDDDFSRIDGNQNPYYVVDRRQNPRRGEPYSLPGSDNKNLFIHTRAEAFPYNQSGVARSVHILRLLSVALGTGTVIISYAIFGLLWPTRSDRRLVALGFVAFMPQFVYISSIINNDNLLIFLATVSLYLVLRQSTDGPSWRGALLLGIVLGAALLTKANAAFLVFPIGLATLLDRRTWRYAPLTLAIMLLVAGWWYVRNMTLYGDLTGARALFEAAQPEEAIRGGAFAPAVGLANLPYAYQTLWARFGPNLVTVGEPVYIFFDVFSILVLAGLAVRLLRPLVNRTLISSDTDSKRKFAIVSVFALSWLLFLLYYVSIAHNGSQGRYLLAGIAGWAVLVAVALDSWTPRRWRMPLALGSVTIMATIALVTLLVYFLPSYQVRPAPAVIKNPLSLRYDNVAELIGIEPATTHVRPGDTVEISLYWRAEQPSATNLQSYLHSLDSELVRRDSLPGTGNLLSTDWQPAHTWTETYIVTIPSDAQTQVSYALIAGLYNPKIAEVVESTDENGKVVIPTVGLIVVHGEVQPFEPEYSFGDIVGMAEPDITVNGEQLQVCLRWVSLSTTEIDYHVFVHLLDIGGQVITQGDFALGAGVYPTSVWLPGESLDDCTSLNKSQLPDGSWQVAIGIYELANGQRLPVINDAGQPLQNNAVLFSP